MVIHAANNAIAAKTAVSIRQTTSWAVRDLSKKRVYVDNDTGNRHAPIRHRS